MAEIHNWHALLPLIVQFSDIFDSVVFDKMLPHKLRGEQSQCQNIECFAKPWLIFTFLVFFARFAIFVKIDTLQRRIFTKPMPIVCCAGFDIFVTLPYCHFCQNRLCWRGLFQHLIRRFATSLAKFCHILHFCQNRYYWRGPFQHLIRGFAKTLVNFRSPFSSKSLLVRKPLCLLIWHVVKALTNFSHIRPFRQNWRLKHNIT